MRFLRRFFERLRNFATRRVHDARLQEEIAEHLSLQTAENLRAGLSPAEARRLAHLKFGGVASVNEDYRSERGLPSLENLMQDLRFAFRMLSRNPGFTAVAVLTLALGIGANTAIFSVVYALLLKPLPYANSASLLNVFQQQPPNGDGLGWSYPGFTELHDLNTVFSAVAGATRHQLTFTGHGEPLEVNTADVTGDFFGLFDAQPLAGRTLYPDDAKPGAPAVVVISETLWRGSLGADSHILGSSINLDQRPFTVIGVMPAAFCLPLFPGVRATNSPEVWIPLSQDPLFGPWIQRPTGHWMQVTARVKPGVTMAQIQAELASFSERFAKDFPTEDAGYVIRFNPLQEMIVSNVRPALVVLLISVGLVLLIACANIANLLLTRATSRAREIAVRTTLGATRARIVRQLLSETAVLGFLGGLAGIALAFWGVRALLALLPPGVPLANTIRVDYFVLTFAMALSLLASVAFGLAPAFLAANSKLNVNLREGGARSGESTGGRRARNVLAVAEIALAMTLLVAAGLLLRSFVKLTAVQPGFDVQHVVSAEVSLPRFQYSTREQWINFGNQLLKQIQSEPGLKDAALTIPPPFAAGNMNFPFSIVGKPSVSASTTRTAHYVAVSPEYFRTMGVPLLAGRFFNDRDTTMAPNVTVISKALAQVYFPTEDPLGKQLVFGFPTDPAVARQIVGIVGDVRDASLGENPKPMMYVPFEQAPFAGAVVVVKSPLSVSSVASTLRHDVAKIDKDVPVTNISAMPDILDSSVAQPRFRTLLLALFAIMALVLAATGIFGVISYSVSCRTHEIGIRMALGASRGAVARLVSRETLILIGSGLLVGTASALVSARLLSHLLFDVSATDPLTLGMVAACLASVAALAAYIPARRAMRVDPLVALRHE